MSADPPDVAGVRHEWHEADGLRMHAALAGPQDAPPMLLVHGWPQHWWMWRHHIADLAADHRVIAVDLRGHGWTDAPRHGYEKERMAADVLALLDVLGLDRVTWVGHDWGGWTGMLAALRAPERFDRLVTMGIPHLWDSSADLRRIAVLAAYQVPVSTPVLGRLLVRGGMVGRLLSHARARGSYTEEEVRAYDGVVRERPWVSTAVYRTFLTRELPALATGRYRAQVLGVPTRMVIGGRDVVTRTIEPGPVPGQPNITVQRIAGVGHFFPEEAPEETLAAIRSG